VSSEGIASTFTSPTLVTTVGPLSRATSERASVAIHPQEVDELTPLNTLCAASVGVFAGIMGWFFVCLGQQHCRSGLQSVGQFTCWAMSFVLFVDLLFFLALTPPGPPPMSMSHMSAANVSCQAVAPVIAATTIFSTTTTFTSTTTMPPPTTPLPEFPIASVIRAPGLRRLDKRWLKPAIRRLDISSIHVQNLWDSSVNGPMWLTVGLVVDVDTLSPSKIVHTADQIIVAGESSVVVILNVIGANEKLREELFTMLQRLLADKVKAGLLRVISAPAKLYPSPPVKRENIDYALLLMAAVALGEFYMLVESDCNPKPSFFSSLKAYTHRLETTGLLEGLIKSNSQ